MKKRKRRKPIAKRTLAVQEFSNAVARIASPQKSENWLPRTIKVVGGIGTILGLLYTISQLWPEISVEPTAAAEPANPFSGYFKITNERGYPLTDVGVETSLRCARIGRGSDTSPSDKCEPSMHTSKRLWTNHTLEPHEPYEITPGDLLFATPGALLYAQISIFVSFHPWNLPIPFKKELRFELRRHSDGKIEWLHLPAD